MHIISGSLIDIVQQKDKNLAFRPVTIEDRAILLNIYGSTRAEELAQTNWTEAQKNIFIESQFEAQRVHYERYYPGAEFLLILYKDTIIGRLYLHVTEQLRIIDIALLPISRNTGLGTLLLTSIQTLAGNKGLPVSIHVEQFNPALQLYKRLGFLIKQTVNSIYYLMEWNPTTPVEKQ